MVNAVIKNNIRRIVKELDKDNKVTSVADEVEIEIQKKVEEILHKGIERAKANNRRTLLARDL